MIERARWDIERISWDEIADMAAFALSHKKESICGARLHPQRKMELLENLPQSKMPDFSNGDFLQFGGFRIAEDPNIPMDEIWMHDATGKTVRVVKLVAAKKIGGNS